MPEWIDKVTSFVASFTKFLDSKDNAQLIGYLEGASGFLSLGAGIAKMISDYKECQKTEYEKSISDLFAFLFSFTSDQIRTIVNSKNLSKKDLPFSNKNEIKSQLKNFFLVYKNGLVNNNDKIDSPWLPLHPLIQKFKNETINWLLSTHNKNIEFVKEFERVFEDRIAYRLYDESNSELDLFRKIAKEDLTQDRLTKYLDFLMKDYHNFYQLNETNRSPISNLPIAYVHDRKAIRLEIKESWNKPDSEIYDKHNNEIENVEEILKDFLDQSQESYLDNSEKLIISASYGVGKTTLVRKLVYDYAIKRGRNAKEYIPIIVYLKNGYYFQSGKSRQSIEQLLRRIFIDFNQKSKY